jgi:hypothetical protein
VATVYRHRVHDDVYPVIWHTPVGVDPVTTLFELLRSRRIAARRAEAIARALRSDPAPAPPPEDPPPSR